MDSVSRAPLPLAEGQQEPSQLRSRGPALVLGYPGLLFLLLSVCQKVTRLNKNIISTNVLHCSLRHTVLLFSYTTYIPRAHEEAASTEYASEPITLKSAGGFVFPSTITLTHFSEKKKKKKKFKNGSYLNIQNKCFCWLKPNIYASASLPIYWCLQPWKDPGSLANTPYLQVFRCHICSQLPAHLGPVFTCFYFMWQASIELV